MWIDARIPVRFGAIDTRLDGEAVITDGCVSGSGAWVHVPLGSKAHPADCTCCMPRSVVATALGLLFRDRATRAGMTFQSVLAAVNQGTEAEIRAALQNDPIVLARYRLASI